MRRDTTRLQTLCRRGIERGFQPGCEVVVHLLRRARAPGGGHHPPPELVNHPLPHRWGLADVVDVQYVQSQPRRPQPLVVTGDAVAIEQRALGYRWGRSGARRLRLGAGRLGVRRHRARLVPPRRLHLKGAGPGQRESKAAQHRS